MTPETIEEHIKKIALLLRYGTQEKIFIAIGAALFGLAASIPALNDEFLKFPPELNQPIALGLYLLGGLCLVWVVYRFLFKLALPKPHDDRELPNAIKGLLAFTQEDGELFRKLGRGQELSGLSNFVKDPQIPLVVIMGESGAGKSSLLRAGLSHALKGSDTAYVYWEALPHNTAVGLLRAVNSALNTDYGDLNALLTLPRKAVIVLDQFEQCLPDNPEHQPLFELLHKVCTASPPHTVTWCVAFRREYSAVWRDFELDHRLTPPRMLSLKLFNAAEAQNVFVTLAEAAGLSLEQDLVDGFIQAVSREQRVSPVEIGIGLQMLNELAQSKQKSQLSLQDYNFAGGSQGLFVSFLNNALAQRFPEAAEREALYKVLLECIDLNRNQRIAEGKSVAQLAANSPDLSAVHLQYALDYFAGAQMRILEFIPGEPPRYRLPHETMIPALRQLGGKILSEVAEAELLLQTSYSAWQNSGNNRRYLLSGKDLKKVLQFHRQLDLRDRGIFLKQSRQQRLNMLGMAFAVMALMPFFAYYGYQSYHEKQYRNSLRDWGLDSDLMDYTGELQSLTLANRNIRDLDWLADFKKLTTLSLVLSDSAIADLSTLQKLNQFTTLTLNLSNSGLTDLSALQELKQLTTLTLELNGSIIADLSALHKLKQLTTLNLILGGSNIEDLSTLHEFKQLTALTLDLSQSDITDLSALHEFKQLTTLNLDLKYSKIADLSPLQELKQLTTLTLRLNSTTTDLSALQELKQITALSLDLGDSSIADLSALQELKQLTTLTLDLGDSSIADLSALQELKQLTTLTLDLFGSKNIDLSTLHELKQLTTLTLDLGDTAIANLSVLHELKQLTTLTLNLRYSLIADLSVLQELKHLTTLTLGLTYSKIADLSTLQELKQLTTLALYLESSDITDLSALHTLKQLTTLTLYLGGSKITDLSALLELKQLTTLALDLGDSEIADLSVALHELKQLTALTLNFRGSKITDLSALQELKQLATLTLDLENSGITELDALKSLQATQIFLNTGNTKIKSLKGLPNLTGLAIGNQ